MQSENLLLCLVIMGNVLLFAYATSKMKIISLLLSSERFGCVVCGVGVTICLRCSLNSAGDGHCQKRDLQIIKKDILNIFIQGSNEIFMVSPNENMNSASL